MALLEGEGLGFGIVGRLKKSIERRGKNVQDSMKDTRETVVKRAAWTPFGIVSKHIQGAREANRELAPGLKEL